jgi:hypothetical protein
MTSRAIVERIFQFLVFGFAIFMVWGGGFSRWESLSGEVTRTVTYTLYRTLPPPPVGPAFCKIVTVGDYGLVIPCDYQPPFVWWLQHRQVS